MDINSTIPAALEPFAMTITGLMKAIGVFVGGIFGLYVLLFFFRIYTYKRNRMLFKRMKRDLNRMSEGIVRIEKKVDSLKRAQAKTRTSAKKK